MPLATKLWVRGRESRVASPPLVESKEEARGEERRFRRNRCVEGRNAAARGNFRLNKLSAIIISLGRGARGRSSSHTPPVAGGSVGH